ncbi:hypothetical protein OB920_10340 [Halobacteria archaeon HArc-gm2]|nr:hypothetical protein [Halobacteria archaeon HArc-gm2]
MKTCLSADYPVRSLLFAGLFLVVGTLNIYNLVALAPGDMGGKLALFRPLWLLIALPAYGLALYTLRNGLPNRSERVQKLFEPRWLADDRE